MSTEPGSPEDLYEQSIDVLRKARELAINTVKFSQLLQETFRPLLADFSRNQKTIQQFIDQTTEIIGDEP